MADFNFLLRTVVALTMASAILAIVVAVLSAWFPMPLAEQLVTIFTDTFKLGVAAILGLIGGRGAHSSGR